MKFTEANFCDSQCMRLTVLTHLREGGVLDEQLRWSQPGAAYRAVRAG